MSNEACDMESGPCACGAWHNPGSDLKAIAKPSAHSSHATLIAELAAERAKVKKLRDALEELVDADKRGLLHRDPLDTDQYFDDARAALAETAE